MYLVTFKKNSIKFVRINFLCIMKIRHCWVYKQRSFWLWTDIISRSWKKSIWCLSPALPFSKIRIEVLLQSNFLHTSFPLIPLIFKIYWSVMNKQWRTSTFFLRDVPFFVWRSLIISILNVWHIILRLEHGFRRPNQKNHYFSICQAV